jgi:acyl-CoA synthetase (AMP-forming)/AMP-acid ligase II
MARPLADALADAAGRFDLSSLFIVASGGALLSPTVRDSIRAHLPDVIVVDGYGSSETGVAGQQATMGEAPATPGSPTFRVDANTAVLDEHDRPVEPGSGTIGRLARRGHLPLGYYKDDEKSRAAFVEIDGERWVVPGDMATVAADGTVTLLGRSSVTINTGGEKVFPEEVELVLKEHPGVFDAVVVGLPDERWGAEVVAVVAARPGHQISLDELRPHCHDRLAGYKVPRELVLVDHIERNPNGKADYAWAERTARSSLVR